MRCEKCGAELDRRDRLRDGAYRCPECGAIRPAPSFRRKSPSPYRRKRGNCFAPAGNIFTRRYFRLPLWSWLVLLLAVIAAIVLIVTLGGRKAAPANDEMPVPEDVVLSVAPASGTPLPTGAPLNDSAADATGAPQGQIAAQTASTATTGTALNDFLTGFDWAMSYLKYDSSLTLASTQSDSSGGTVNRYTFADWLELQLTIDPATNLIRSATATAQLEEGSTDNLRALASLAAVMYGLDKTLSGGACRSELEAMVADNSRSFSASSFTATLATGTFSGYTMEVVGTKQ